MIKSYIDSFVHDQFRPFAIIKKKEMELIPCMLAIELYKDSHKIIIPDNCRRAIIISHMIDLTMKQHKIKLPDGVSMLRIYIFVTDGVHFGDVLDPVLQIVSFETYPNIIIPDNSFFEDPSSSERTNWDKMKANIIRQLSTEKQNVMFFKGADTGCTTKAKTHVKFCIRQKLSILPYKWIKIDVGNAKVPIHEFSKFKYLLNLPGNQPWSYRFKFLFLMKSLVINVNVIGIYADYGVVANKFINFYDKFFRELVWNEYYTKSSRMDVSGYDYITVNCLFYKLDKTEGKTLEDMAIGYPPGAKTNIVAPSIDNLNYLNEIAFQSMVTQLKNLYDYFEAYPEDYDTIVSNGFNRVQQITNNSILYSVYRVIQTYADRYH